MLLRKQISVRATHDPLVSPGIVYAHACVVAVKNSFVTLAWRTREQRERE